MKKFLPCVTLFLFLQKSFSQSQTIDYKDAFHLIDSWIEAQRDYADIPSISVAIVKNQETIWSKAYRIKKESYRARLPLIIIFWPRLEPSQNL